MGKLRSYVGNLFVLVVVLLGVTNGFCFAGDRIAIADTPGFTLNSSRYCAEASWNLKVTNAAPNAAIRLIGVSNEKTWEIPKWANTDANGNFSTTGIFAADAAGSHTLRVEISGATSETLPVEVVNCGWRNTTSMSTARSYHTTTLLGNGMVLVTGGSSSASDSAELYNPATETWSFTGKLNTAHSDYTTTLLPSGKVLVAGGYRSFSARGMLNSAELYDPATETWSVTGNLNADLDYPTATLLPNGKVLVVGGVGISGVDGGWRGTAELYDPATGSWTETGGLITGRIRFTATLLTNGKVLVAGGGTDNHYEGLGNAELYDPATRQWSATGSLTAPRAGHTATLLPNGKVLVAEGYNKGEPLNSAELYDPATGTWSVTQFNTARSGWTVEGYASPTLTLLPNGMILVTGGVGRSPVGALNRAELYDPATGAWSPAAPLSAARYSHTATLLPNGKVLVVGGIGAERDPGVVSLKSAELYDGGFEIPSLTLNSTTFCVGTPWTLTVTHAAHAASVRLVGVSNGAPWEIARWGATDADGSFRTSGTIVGGTEGTHTLRVEINGVWSKTVSFAVSNCKP